MVSIYTHQDLPANFPAHDSLKWEDFREYFKQLFQEVGSTRDLGSGPAHPSEQEIHRLSIKEEVNTLTKVMAEGFASLASQNSQSTTVHPEAGPFPRRPRKERGLPVRHTPEENAFHVS